MKQRIDVFEYAGQICKQMSKGILLTTKTEDFVNTMTIGWGALGIEWGKKLFIAYVRESRFTREIIDKTGEFTINVPLNDIDRRIIRHCGSESGRDTDKIKDLHLTLVESDVINAPGIKELPITLECRVMYSHLQNSDRLPEATLDLYYPEEDEGKRDNHIAYYAEIVNAYLITE